MISHPFYGAAVGAVALLAIGCASGPVPALERGRSTVAALRSDPVVTSHAEVQVDETQRALDNLERAAHNDASKTELEHLGYIVEQRADLARTVAEQAQLSERGEKLGEERTALLLDAREKRAQEAEARAATAEAARDQALSQRQHDQVAAAEARSRDAEARAQSLLGQLNDLKTQQTDRGMVLTLSDVLFATGQATLQPGALRTLDRVAEFLNEYPDRKVTIEGHTDNVGNPATNEELSQARANAVADYLVSQQVDRGRITSRGLGESLPIAPNTTLAGRQQNRRVDIVIAPPKGGGAI
jgi:outer membrane protein OmpA-like peptidoglycan-associated protein